MDKHLKNNAIVQRILLAPQERIGVLFTLILLLFVGALLWKTFDYSEYAKIIPLLVGVPIFAFLWFVLLSQVSDRFEATIERYRINDLFNMSDGFANRENNDSEESQSLAERRTQFFTISVWIIMLLLVFVFVGIKVALAAFLLGYYRFQANQSLSRTVGYSVGIWGFIYIVFEILLGNPL